MNPVAMSSVVRWATVRNARELLIMMMLMMMVMTIATGIPIRRTLRQTNMEPEKGPTNTIFLLRGAYVGYSPNS